MSNRSGLNYCAAALIIAAPAVLFAQWPDYPTSGVPRNPDGKPNLTAPAPRTGDGKPDFSGMWGWETRANCGAKCDDTQVSREFINIASTLKNPLPYQPWVAELVKKRGVEQGLDPNVHCMPRGAPRIWTDDYYKRIFQVPGRVIILTERNMQYRQIFTDGRPLPPDPNPTWNGYSIGHWEGDTLVVDTVGFNDRTWLDAAGHPHGEKLHVIERYTRTDSNTLQVAATMEDPDYYTKPWTVVTTATWAPGQELLEYICQENNRDTQHLVGK
jgi:hypothetical protein